MDPRLGKYGFRLAMFITVTSAALLFIEPPGTAEYYITLFSLGIGLLFLASVWMLTRLLER